MMYTKITDRPSINFRLLTFTLVVMQLLGGCEQFLEIEPPKTQLVQQTVFHDEASAKAAIRGVYSYMMDKQGFASGGSSSITLLTGLSSDEFINYSPAQERVSFRENALNADNSLVRDQLWQQLYKCIYFANSILEGLEQSALNTTTKDRLMAEAFFVRAFCYFYLVNLFGDVPLITGTDYRQNMSTGRTGVASVYEKIAEDLEAARLQLPEDFPQNHRAYPNRYAALALLARVNLYRQEWEKAEQRATEIINSPLFALESDLERVFLNDSQEAIWQLAPVIPGYNTWEGVTFLLTGKPNLVAMPKSAADSFEPNDLRKSNWVDSISVNGETYYFPTKYKKKLDAEVTEYSMVMRLAEIYLLRAEAKLNQNDLDGAKLDINIVRNRAGLEDVTTNDPESLAIAIEMERQNELFAEWGHRWFDLKRLGKATTTLAPLKLDWQETDQLYPIPQREILNDPNLVQNPGY